MLLLLFSACLAAQEPRATLERLDEFPHARSVATSEATVRDYELGLGALQKIRGSWRFKESVRLSGLLLRHTWQIVDGYSSEEVLADLQRELDEIGNATLLFSCDGRACGHGAQWANRVFQQRVLYGLDEMQRYRVYRIEGQAEYRLALYASGRTADRQYLHADLLRLEQTGQ